MMLSGIGSTGFKLTNEFSIYENILKKFRGESLLDSPPYLPVSSRVKYPTLVLISLTITVLCTICANVEGYTEK